MISLNIKGFLVDVNHVPHVKVCWFCRCKSGVCDTICSLGVSLSTIPEVTSVAAFIESASFSLDKYLSWTIMDAIKKKMQSLKSETDNALTKAEELDREAKEATQRAEKYEENVRKIYK